MERRIKEAAYSVDRDICIVTILKWELSSFCFHTCAKVCQLLYSIRAVSNSSSDDDDDDDDDVRRTMSPVRLRIENPVDLIFFIISHAFNDLTFSISLSPTFSLAISHSY